MPLDRPLHHCPRNRHYCRSPLHANLSYVCCCYCYYYCYYCCCCRCWCCCWHYYYYCCCCYCCCYYCLNWSLWGSLSLDCAGAFVDYLSHSLMTNHKIHYLDAAALWNKIFRFFFLVFDNFVQIMSNYRPCRIRLNIYFPRALTSFCLSSLSHHWALDTMFFPIISLWQFMYFIGRRYFCFYFSLNDSVEPVDESLFIPFLWARIYLFLLVHCEIILKWIEYWEIAMWYENILKRANAIIIIVDHIGTWIEID